MTDDVRQYPSADLRAKMFNDRRRRRGVVEKQDECACVCVCLSVSVYVCVCVWKRKWNLGIDECMHGSERTLTL